MEDKLKAVTKLYMESIEIPNELEKTITAAIKRGKRETRLISFLRPLASVAAALLIFTGALNISEPFARAASSMPIIGSIARVLTFRLYEEKTPSYIIRVKTPQISGLSDSSFEKRVNKEIDTRLRELEAQIKAQTEKDRQAFIATGGKPENFKPVQITIDYELKKNSNNELSFIITKTASTFAAYNETLYYNIDLNVNSEITLESIFGKDYIATINAGITKQIEERKAKGDPAFLSGGMSFKTISPKQNFYINEAGNPVIVFEKYAITAGAYGPQYFEIKR